jgi:hypothetical protein
VFQERKISGKKRRCQLERLELFKTVLSDSHDERVPTIASRLRPNAFRMGRGCRCNRIGEKNKSIPILVPFFPSSSLGTKIAEE